MEEKIEGGRWKKKREEELDRKGGRIRWEGRWREKDGRKKNGAKGMREYRLERSGEEGIYEGLS